MLIYSRGMMLSPWYRRIFPTRFAAHRQAVQEFVTTRQGYRLATSTRWGADRTWGRHHRDR
jgi:predicted transcriptional regulator